MHCGASQPARRPQSPRCCWRPQCPAGQRPRRPAAPQTELCRSWEETGTCRYGAKCQFAHGREELRPVQRHPKYKTEVRGALRGALLRWRCWARGCAPLLSALLVPGLLAGRAPGGWCAGCHLPVTRIKRRGSARAHPRFIPHPPTAATCAAVPHLLGHRLLPLRHALPLRALPRQPAAARGAGPGHARQGRRRGHHRRGPARRRAHDEPGARLAARRQGWAAAFPGAASSAAAAARTHQ
jgi:hypothetical protein